MTLNELKERLAELPEEYGDWAVVIPASRGYATMGGTPTVNVTYVNPGFDWNSHKIMLMTNVKLLQIKEETHG